MLSLFVGTSGFIVTLIIDAGSRAQPHCAARIATRPTSHRWGPLAWWWWLTPATTSTIDPYEAVRKICACVEIGFERTGRHDVGLGIRQIVDIAIKATSPAVNDPYTAMQASSCESWW